MAFRNWRIRHLISRRLTGLALVALALLSISLLMGCAGESQRSAQPIQSTVNLNDPPQADQSGSESSTEPAESVYAPRPGSPGLNRIVFDADVIARARLIGTNTAAEYIGENAEGVAVYRGLVNFTFHVLEYLKGSSDDELVVGSKIELESEAIRYIMNKNATGGWFEWWEIDDRNPYTSKELALLAAKHWEEERNTLWDEREAIILAREVAAPDSSDGTKRYSFGHIFAYALDSRNGLWLPAAVEVDVNSMSADASQGESRFLLEAPNHVTLDDASQRADVAPATMSISEMTELIEKTELWRKKGEEDKGFLKCIRASFDHEAFVNGKKERGESLNNRFDFGFGSGLPAETVVYDGAPWPGRVWIEGVDIGLFDFSTDNNGILLSTRPLPAGEYSVYHKFQADKFIPCEYHTEDIRNEWFVHVMAPDGVLHEAFFDPVEIGSSVGADASNGVLEPASFEDEGGTSTIDRIAWESQQVRMEFSASAPPSGHHVDFIALDGSVALRLKVDDATQAVDGGGTALSWGVCSQPWETGDKLMLRISESGPDLTGVTNDTECPSSGQ